MTYADEDPDPADTRPTPGWFSWPNIPIIGVTLGTLLDWYQAWRKS